MLSSIDDENPVMFVEHKAMYTMKGDVDSFEPIPLGKGDIKRSGEDVTIIATGKMVHEALAAAKILEEDGISAEVLDPRTLYPLDKKLIAQSLGKTHKAVIVTEENRSSIAPLFALVRWIRRFPSLPFWSRLICLTLRIS